MIDEIRKHIKDQIKAISSQYLETDKPFAKDEDLIDTKADYTFYTEFGATTQEINLAGESVDNVAVTLKTYRQGARDNLADFDEGYCQALLINSLILDNAKLNSAKYILSVTSGGITPSEVLDSQDIYTYTNNLIFKISYGIGD